MHPELILPRAYPDRLRDPAYDPYELMPATLPPGPRGMYTPERLATTRANIRRHDWAKRGLDLLRAQCLTDPTPGGEARCALRHALAYRLTDETLHRDHALLLIGRYVHRPDLVAYLSARGWAAASRAVADLAMAVDLLRDIGAFDADEALASLLAARSVVDLCPHHKCGNHNTHTLAHASALAVATGDRQLLHDVLYGWPGDGHWRYGLIHQLRHDFLPDGLHWEGTPGYHFYTLMAMTNAVDVLAGIGIDLWHHEFPALVRNDLEDLHDVYGPSGTRSLKAAFDAPLWAMHTNGDLSLLHDTGLANIRGVWIWGLLYNLADEAYQDPAYGWLLNKMETDYTVRERPGLPMPLQTHHADLDFPRVRAFGRTGRAPTWRGRRTLSLAGRMQRGCTLFPSHGSAVLRTAPTDPTATAAYVYWGPHRAGHQSPAALHLDLHSGGRALSEAPRDHGYEKPTYLTWVRTTVAHNTVCIDESPMFPYDVPTDSVFEADRWRDRRSDGQLLRFQPGPAGHAIRVANDQVYPGVTLDRTVIVTADFILDLYRVVADTARQIDWTMHLVGDVPIPAAAQPLDLGDARGYRHLEQAYSCPSTDSELHLRWPCRDAEQTAHVLLPAGATAILARDFVPYTVRQLGEIEDPPSRTCLLIRSHSDRALFASLWPRHPDPTLTLSMPSGAAEADVQLLVHGLATTCRLHLPASPRTPITFP